MYIRLPLDNERYLRLAGHRYGMVGNLVVIEEPNGDRIDLYLSDEQIRRLAHTIDTRMAAHAEAVS